MAQQIAGARHCGDVQVDLVGGYYQPEQVEVDRADCEIEDLANPSSGRESRSEVGSERRGGPASRRVGAGCRTRCGQNTVNQLYTREGDVVDCARAARIVERGGQTASGDRISGRRSSSMCRPCRDEEDAK